MTSDCDHQGLVFALRIETVPTPSISVWDVERAQCRQLSSASNSAGCNTGWAIAASADFDTGKAVIATKTRALELWDLRLTGSPVASTEPGAANFTVLHAFGLGSAQARVVCGVTGGNIEVWDATGQNSQFRQIQTLCGHTEDVQGLEFGMERGKLTHLVSLAANGEPLFWDFREQDSQDAVDGLSCERMDSKTLRQTPISPVHKVEDPLRESMTKESIDKVLDDMSQQETGSSPPSMSGWMPSSSQPSLGQGQTSPALTKTTSAAAQRQVKPLMIPKVASHGTKAVAYRHQCSNPDKPCAVSGTSAGDIRVWFPPKDGLRFLSEAPDSPLQGHTDQVSALCVDFDKSVVVSASLDRSLRVWDIQAEYMHCKHALTGHTGSVRTLVSDIPRGRAASTGADHKLRLWDLGLSDTSTAATGGRCLADLPLPSGGATELLVSFSCGRAAVTMREGSLCCWDLERLEPLTHVQSHPGSIYAVQIGSTGNGSWDPLDCNQPQTGVRTSRTEHFQPVRTGARGWCKSRW